MEGEKEKKRLSCRWARSSSAILRRWGALFPLSQSIGAVPPANRRPRRACLAFLRGKDGDSLPPVGPSLGKGGRAATASQRESVSNLR
ncbi:hypothetical protein HMPREF0262_03159 [Clostridium sp. ATCC 29733]|nr:hypothetical protein HMPREF0262_03159 [Clostridium sp. ATCC 29733]